jgi:hypothetical protein
MPAKSKAQGRLMRLALAYKKGYVKDSEVSDNVRNIADSMTIKELEKYARTPEKGLPMHVDEEFATLDATPGMGDVTPPTATTPGSGDTFNAYGLYTQGFLKKTKKDRKAKKTDPMKHYHPEKGVVNFQPHGSVVYFQDFIKNLKTKDASEFHDHNDDYQGFINTDSQYLGPVSGDGGYDDGDD